MFKFCLLSIVLLPLALGFNFERCIWGKGPEEVIINHCEQPPCHFYRGDHIVGNAFLEAPFDSQNLTAQLDYIDRSNRYTLPLPDEISNACLSQNIQPACPIVKGVRYDYTFEMDLEMELLIEMQTRLEIMLKDDDNINMFCIAFDAVIHPHKRPCIERC